MSCPQNHVICRLCWAAAVARGSTSGPWDAYWQRWPCSGPCSLYPPLLSSLHRQGTASNLLAAGLPCCTLPVLLPHCIGTHSIELSGARNCVLYLAICCCLTLHRHKTALNRLAAALPCCTSPVLLPGRHSIQWSGGRNGVLYRAICCCLTLHRQVTATGPLAAGPAQLHPFVAARSWDATRHSSR